MGVLDAPAADWRGSSLSALSTLRDLPNVLAHLDARDLTQTNGATVSRWGERTGYGYDFATPTGATAPTMKRPGLNGQPTVAFSSGAYMRADGLANPTLSGGAAWGQIANAAQPYYFAAVVKCSSANTGASIRHIIGSNTTTSSGNVGLWMTATNLLPQVYAGANGALGGPQLNDDTWHVIIGGFETTRGWIMLDGNVIASAASQSHGTNALNQVALGAAITGTLATAGMELAEVIILAGKQMPLTTAERLSAKLAARWGLTYTAPKQANVWWKDVTDSGGQTMRVFAPPNPAASVGLVLFNHPQGATVAINPDYWAYPVIHTLVAAGYVVAVNNNHGLDSWSNDAAETDVTNARAWVNTNVAPVSGTVFLGASMGGSLSVIAAKDAKVPDLRGVYLIDPAVNLQWMYANGYSTSINTGFGIAAAANIPTGKDPVTLTGGQLPQNIRWRACASAADVTVSKANNIDVLAPIIQAAAPAEYALVTHPDGHIGKGAGLPGDVLAFIRRCLG